MLKAIINNDVDLYYQLNTISNQKNHMSHMNCENQDGQDCQNDQNNKYSQDNQNIQDNELNNYDINDYEKMIELMYNDDPIENISENSSNNNIYELNNNKNMNGYFEKKINTKKKNFVNHVKMMI